MSYELLLFARVTSYLLHTKLRVFVYCISYELSFAYELRVTSYCASYELHFGYELQVTVYCMSYELFFEYEF